MKKIITYSLFCFFYIGGLQAQDSLTNQANLNKEDVSLDAENEEIKISSSTPGIWQGLTKKIPYRKMITPHGLEVGYEKTTHIIFPSPVVYVDLGNDNIMVSKAGSAENVIRVKSTQLFFENETNIAVITEDGNFYTFNVKFAHEPEQLNIEMQDFLNDGCSENRPNNSLEIFLTQLENESPSMVRMMSKAIYQQNRRLLKHIGSSAFGVRFVLKGIYTHNNLMYMHFEIKNNTNVNYDIDYFSLNIVDKKLVKRTAIQESPLLPVRAHNYVSLVKGKETQRIVLVFPLFTVLDTKNIRVDLHEKRGGRHQQFFIENTDLIRAKKITDLILGE